MSGTPPVATTIGSTPRLSRRPAAIEERLPVRQITHTGSSGRDRSGQAGPQVGQVPVS